MSYKDLSVD